MHNGHNTQPIAGCKGSSASVGGVAVSMVAFQAVDPGSTPGRRTGYTFCSMFNAIQVAIVPNCSLWCHTVSFNPSCQQIGSFLLLLIHVRHILHIGYANWREPGEQAGACFTREQAVTQR